MLTKISPSESKHAKEKLGYPHQILSGDLTPKSISTKVSDIVLEGLHPKSWLYGFAVVFALVMLLLFAISWLFYKGVGIWGIQIPVAWGFAIVNFVWWIGIGHAGTFISAILLLLYQEWRNSINRFAESMTLFAVACAALFPLLHLGRPWVFYWLLPYPNTMGLWPQFRSPLVWDCFAVGTYFTVSLLFWFIGLIPDLATLRDRAKTRRQQVIYGILATGWRGSARHWHNYRLIYLLLAGLATPLVLSVHSVVSFDFSVAILPGWHSTIFPPYFVAGAIFSGFAMVLNIIIPVRKMYGLEQFITKRHFNNMANIMLVTGLIVDYGYLCEAFFAWYSADLFEQSMMYQRMFGPSAWAFWLLVVCNVVAPQFLWIRAIRINAIPLFIVSLFINIGMWLERFVIVITSLQRDYLPSIWRTYSPTIWDWATFIGTIGLFLTLLLLFIRTLPMFSAMEEKELLIKELKEA